MRPAVRPWRGHFLAAKALSAELAAKRDAPAQYGAGSRVKSEEHS
jgi:hypothetical protein